jgi:hypothetical protein
VLKLERAVELGGSECRIGAQPAFGQGEADRQRASGARRQRQARQPPIVEAA